MKLSDQENWAKFATGDPEIWHLFVREQTVRLYAVFMKRWPNPALAEELTQKTIFDAVKARQSYNPEKGNPEKWIYAIALNNLRLEIRKRAIREKTNSDLPEMINTIDTAPLPDELIEKEQTAQLVNSALDRLDDKQKSVLKAKYIDDLKASEIARKMNLTTKAVHSLLYRAKIALKDKLKAIAPSFTEGTKS